MPSSEFPVTIPALHQMKRARQKIVGVVAWDFQVAQIVDRAGVEIVSVGDSVGTNLWGHPNPLAVTMDEMIVVCRAVRRGVRRAIVSCDIPFGPLQQGIDSALRAAILAWRKNDDRFRLIGRLFRWLFFWPTVNPRSYRRHKCRLRVGVPEPIEPVMRADKRAGESDRGLNIKRRLVHEALV